MTVSSGDLALIYQRRPLTSNNCTTLRGIPCARSTAVVAFKIPASIVGCKSNSFANSWHSKLLAYPKIIRRPFSWGNFQESSSSIDFYIHRYTKVARWLPNDTWTRHFEKRSKTETFPFYVSRRYMQLLQMSSVDRNVIIITDIAKRFR